MTTTDLAGPAASGDLARSARMRRVGLAAAMLTAPWFIVAANTGYFVTTLHGGDDLEPSHAIALANDHLSLDRWSNLAALLGSLLLVPAVLGAMHLVRTRAARLGLVGGVLMAAAYICYFAMVFQAFTVDAMVKVGGSSRQNVGVLQAVLDEPLILWVPVLFVVGNLIGTFLLGLALVRARTVSRIAGLGLMVWPVSHLLGLPFLEAAGAAAQAVGFAVAACALLRGPAAAAAGPQPYELLRR
jgi:hypothetical protein